MLFAASPAAADMIDTSGMQPWEICGMCHSLDGISAMAKFPKLAGQRAAYIEKQFMDMHAGRRTNEGGQMQAITLEIDHGDLPAIAAYFAGLPAPPPASFDAVDGATVGQSLFDNGRDGVPACRGCHDTNSPDMPLAPWLEAQHEAYLSKQLSDFKGGERDNDPDGVMRAVAISLSEYEIAALAAYLAAQPRPKRDP
ncbi:c-type cytochrome [Roseibium sp.]|uniref:c-type cytochrome n=1 Tax=Roseibium sp. TaxID=1936156 RepID=UPI003A97E79D